MKSYRATSPSSFSLWVVDRLAQYENLFEEWGIGDLDFDELKKWHERML